MHAHTPTAEKGRYDVPSISHVVHAPSVISSGYMRLNTMLCVYQKWSHRELGLKFASVGFFT